MNINFGIYLQYSPGTALRKEGLGRLVAFLVGGLQDIENVEVTIAAPIWLMDSLLQLFEDNKLNLNKINFISSPEIRYGFFLKAIGKLINLDTKVYLKIKKILIEIKTYFYSKIFSNYRIKWLIKNRFLGFYYRIFWGPIGIFPVLISKMYYLSIKLIKKILRDKSENTKNVLMKIIKNLFKALKNTIYYMLFELYKKPLNFIYRKLIHREVKALVANINSKKDIKAWLVPAAFWPEIKDIQAKKIMVFPDAVYLDFPEQYASWVKAAGVDVAFSMTTKLADAFITYSQYVKENHLCKHFGIEPNLVTVVRQGGSNLLPLLLGRPDVTNMPLVTSEISKEAIQNCAWHIIKDYQEKNFNVPSYFYGIDLRDISYIFYSSQPRAHKNFLNLVKAFEILLRKRFINVKLIITADLRSLPEIYNYVQEKKLNYDIISLCDVPADVLAALFCLAKCMVNPTLFEGGSILTFSESYSVGTPSVMSRIPATLEDIEDEQLREEILFNPYDPLEMANKIEWALNNRDELYRLEAPLYAKFAKRTWKVVAEEYVKAYEQWL